MTLDEQLRAALSQEADMQTVPRPDIDELISGGRERRRHRNWTRFSVAAAAVVVLVAGGAYGVTRSDSVAKGEPANTSKPSQSAAPQPLSIDGGTDLAPDTTYRMLVGVGATGASIEADLTVDGPGWSSGNYPVVSDGAASGGLGVYRPQALAAGSGCDSDSPDYEVAATAPALAEQLSQLPRSTVVQAVTPRRAFGRDALHLRARIDSECPVGEGYRVAEAPRGSFGISYNYYDKVIVDFWVVDVDRVPVVVSTWHHDVASSALVDRIDRTREAITFTADH